MAKVHRSVLERLGPPPVPAVLLDTPFGFQENATELAQRVIHYFAESLRAPIEVASTSDAGLEGDARPIETDDPFANERLLAKVRDARYIFAGPGSPSYALRKWKGTVVPSLLNETLEHGGAVTFSSAAALTLGILTVPVYEVYKVGEDPFWLDGLNVLGVTGLSAAVIPHYNNAEGGTHDTRFCYLGERRLSMLEAALPDGSFVLGVDEHTALVLDLDERAGTVAGNGVVTVRAGGRSRTWASGETIGFDELASVAMELRRGHTGAKSTSVSLPLTGNTAEHQGSPLLDVVRQQEADFSAALDARDVSGAVKAILALETDITAWSHDIPAGDALDRARASLRSLVVELGNAGEEGVRDPREVLGPFVKALLDLRQKARADGRFEDADEVRARLAGLGVEVRDSSGETEWILGES
ncbi:MAG: CysS/YqeB C-terminal domain-containing protein [Acidimicrobiales bacterium]